MTVLNHFFVLATDHSEQFGAHHEKEDHGYEGYEADDSAPLQVFPTESFVSSAPGLADQGLQGTVKAIKWSHSTHVDYHVAHANCGQLGGIVEMANEYQVHSMHQHADKKTKGGGHHHGYEPVCQFDRLDIVMLLSLKHF